MRVSEIRVKRIRVNQGLGVQYYQAWKVESGLHDSDLIPSYLRRP